MAARLEVALLDKEQELSAIFEGVPLMMVLLDRERRVLRINRQAVEFVGRAEGEILGRCLGEAVGCPRAVEAQGRCGSEAYCQECRIRAMVATAMQSGEGEKGQEIRHQLRMGGLLKELILSVSVIPLTIRAEPTVLLTFQDVTGYRALEEELQQAQRLESIGTLSSGIAHDFNNILSAITGYTDLAIVGSQGNQTVLADLAEIRRAAARATDLVRKILTFSRRHRYEKIPIQVSTVVAEALLLLRATIPATIDIRQELASTATILGDRTQLHQLVMNLCTNAYQAMVGGGGTLGVTLREVRYGQAGSDGGVTLPPGRYVVLAVSDTGCGMTREVMARAFEPYFSTKGTEHGTGLGLAVVHGIVTSLQGRITVASEPGQGATFTVYLPMVEVEPASAVMAPVPVSQARGPLRIMLVDDEAAIRAVMRRILELNDYRVDTFVNGLEAWQALSAMPEAWDLLVTDQNMPGLTGNQLAAKALAIRPELPIVLWSGYFSANGESAPQPPGIFATLNKPVDYATLLQRITEALLAPSSVGVDAGNGQDKA